MTEQLNPYIAGAPVTDERMFFGREDVFEWVEHSLTGQYADHILVIHGQRRVGKTSVLKQLPHRLPSRYIPVFFDLQGRTRTTLDRFLWWLAREIVRVVKQDRGLALPLPEKETFSQDTEYLEGHFLPELRRLLPDQNLLLTFDEFDTLEEEKARETLGLPLTETLHRLMGREGLNFIFSIGSSGRKLENMQASYTEFFKAALYKKVSFLGEQQAYNLITRPVEGILEYEESAVRAICEITSGHPYFTQLICHELFAMYQKTGQPTISPADVSGVLDEVVERGTVNLKFVWDEATELEKWSLAGLAHAAGRMDSHTLAAFLKTQRVRFSQPDLEAALIHLREKDVLTGENAFVNLLLRLWLQRNRPLEQVREELTEVNPIANRYIEIGLEYLESGLHEKAVESFQEALAVDGDNLPAMVHIGQVHLQQLAFAEAVSQFERALSIDEEDVSARAGLCQAHLALGDQAAARGKTKDAQRSYQQILTINPEHTDARQRMADICRQQAEKSLAEKKDEEALNAFRQALQFTPEDQALEARVREVEEQKRSLVQAMLRARADQAIREQRWEQAVTPLEQALALQPGDPDLQGMLAQAQAGIRASQLALAKARAANLARAERWERALQAWGDYLALDPEDRVAAEGEIARVEQARAVANSYARAQAALANKDYDAAVGLLKAIVVEDEGYKDASRLMAEAIELRRTRRRIWQTNWARIGIVGVAVAGLVGLALWAGPWQSPGPSPTAPPTAVAAAPSVAPTRSTDSAAATATSTAAPMPTAIPLSWARLSSGQFLPRDAITAIVFDPTDPGVIYVGTRSAGVYKTIDGSLSWQPSGQGLGGASVASLQMDPGDPQVLYASIDSAGLYKTTDGGNSWSPIMNGFEFRAGDAIPFEIDPLNSQRLVATNTEKLYVSENGGQQWELIGRATCPDRLWELALHPQSASVLYATGGGSARCPEGVYRTEDGGSTWIRVGLQTEGYVSYPRIATNQQGTASLYVRSPDGPLYSSADEGETWQALPFEWCDRAFPVSEGGVYVWCTLNGIGGIQYSQDGTSWQTLLYPGTAPIDALAVSPSDPGTILAGGPGLAASLDGGASWVNRSSGLPAASVELKIDPVDTTNLLLHDSGEALGDCGPLQRSSDGGRSWVALAERGCRLLFDADGQTMYRYDYQTLFRSPDRGGTWEGLPLSFRPDRLGADPRREHFLYGFPAGGSGTVLTSADRGETWGDLAGSTLGPMEGASLFFSSAGDEVVYLTPRYGAYRSEDGGETWAACDSAIESTSVTDSRLTIDPRDSMHIYVAQLGRGIATSTDGCREWNWLSSFPTVNVNSLAIDPAQPERLYAGADTGAYVSFDGGETWGEINDGLLGATVVYSIVVDPQSDVYAATPYGVFKLEAK